MNGGIQEEENEEQVRATWPYNYLRFSFFCHAVRVQREGFTSARMTPQSDRVYPP